jgi:hypothetical protein
MPAHPVVPQADQRPEQLTRCASGNFNFHSEYWLADDRANGVVLAIHDRQTVRDFAVAAAELDGRAAATFFASLFSSQLAT